MRFENYFLKDNSVSLRSRICYKDRFQSSLYSLPHSSIAYILGILYLCSVLYSYIHILGTPYLCSLPHSSIVHILGILYLYSLPHSSIVRSYIFSASSVFVSLMSFKQTKLRPLLECSLLHSYLNMSEHFCSNCSHVGSGSDVKPEVDVERTKFPRKVFRDRREFDNTCK